MGIGRRRSGICCCIVGMISEFSSSGKVYTETLPCVYSLWEQFGVVKRPRLSAGHVPL